MHQNYCGASPGYPWDLILRLGSVTNLTNHNTGDPTRESPHDRGEKANHPQLYGLSEAFTILGTQEHRRNLKGWDDKCK